MVKTVLFDLDETIFDFKLSERTALTKTLVELGIESTDEIIELYSGFNIAEWKKLELGQVTREELKVNRYRNLFNAIGVDASPEKATALYENHLASRHFFIDGAVDMLEGLYNKYDLYIVSNGTKAVQDGRLKSANISHYFKQIFISEDIGYSKPYKEFFDGCFDRIGDIELDECVIIGDSLSSDIKGGKNAGIRTIWYNRFNETPTDIIPDYEIKNIDEIENLLAKI